MSLITIESSAFLQQNPVLTTVTIPAGTKLETIGESAFFYWGECKLTGFDLSACTELRSIGESAFGAEEGVMTCFDGALDLSGCTKLTSIGACVFRETGITSLRLPASLRSIGEFTFYGCPNLSSVEIPEGSQLTSIGEEAFDDCGFTSIVLPCANLSYVGRCAFSGTVLKTRLLPDHEKPERG